ncbi:MAG: hypothetical protein A4E28_00013 [Methanocella sp. PtaU1.Bin125]|nr:MAG: hypothetical protein A4E28_00013 [Methanocella sp. PtaU1.Bin125]
MEIGALMIIFALGAGIAWALIFSVLDNYLPNGGLGNDGFVMVVDGKLTSQGATEIAFMLAMFAFALGFVFYLAGMLLCMAVRKSLEDEGIEIEELKIEMERDEIKHLDDKLTKRINRKKLRWANKSEDSHTP